MTTVALPAQTSGFHKPGFFSQLNAEWTKLRSVRALYIQAVLAVVLSVGITALICLAIASRWDAPGAANRRADFNPVTTSLFGMAFGYIVLTITGVTLVASEYTSGMIRLTMAVTPSRLRVLFAKAVVVAVVTWAIGLVIVLGSFFAGQTVLGTHAGIPTATLSDSNAQRGVLVAWLTMPLFPLIGAALGAILRSTASAITATLGLIFAPGIFGGLLPDWWQKNLLAYLPGSAGDTLLNGDHSAVTYLAPGVAIAAILVWIALFFGVAAVMISKRDV